MARFGVGVSLAGRWLTSTLVRLWAGAPESATRVRLLPLVAFVALLASHSARAQSYIYATGSPTFTTAEPVELGFINLANGNLHIEIPLTSPPQRGTIPFSAALVYDSRIWINGGSGSSWAPVNVPNSQGGWRLVTSVDKGIIDDNEEQPLCDDVHTYTTRGPFLWTEANGTPHSFAIFTVHYVGPSCQGTNVSSGDAMANDSSGFHMFVTNYADAQVYAKDGTLVYSAAYLRKDTNGNYFNLSGSNIVDTLGRSPVTSSTNGGTTTYSLLNSEGGTSSVAVKTTTVNYHTAFTQTNITDVSGSFTAVSEIDLPDSTTYTFAYDSGTTAGHYGLLTGITLPTGGSVTYGYTTFTDIYSNKNRWVNSRTTSSPAGTWSYVPATAAGCGQQQGCQTVTVTKPSTDQAVHTFTLNNGAWNSETDFYTGSLSLQMTLSTAYDFSNGCDPRVCNGAQYIRAQTDTTKVPSVGGATLTKQVQYAYDSPAFGNLTQIKEWQWTTGTPGATPDRITNIGYLATTPYLNANIINRPSSITVTTGGGTWVRETDIKYDTAGLASIGGIVNWVDPNTNIRGNPTRIQRLLFSGATCPSATACLETDFTYDLTGQVASVADPKVNTTTLTYADNFFNDDGNTPPASYSPSQATNAYLTHITPAITALGAVVRGYYFGTGKPASVTDLNGAASFEHYRDALDRLTQNLGPVVNSVRGWQLRQYPSGSENEIDVFTGVTDAAVSSGCTSCRKDVITLDAFGRVTRSQIANDPDGATNADTAYDASERVSSASYPYRTSGNFDSFVYDGVNRLTSVTHSFDSNAQQMFYGSAVSSNGGLATQQCASGTYGVGFPSVFVDEAGRKRQQWTDGFGRNIETDEPNPATGSLTTNGTSTCYKYDLLDNLAEVDQGGQVRTFQHDAVSRVTSVTTPETSAATTIYYVTASNALCSGDPSAACRRTDPRGITTTYAYDALNRLVSKTYSDSTPTVKYGYDGTAPSGCTPPSLTASNPKGRRTSMCDASGAVSWSYDAAGRYVTEKRTNAGITRRSDYTYTVGGQLASINFPYDTTPDRNVAYTYNVIGRPLQAADSLNSITYVKNATYAPQGAIASYLAGNTGGFGGINVNDSYNNRLQPGSFSAAVAGNTIFSETFSFIDTTNGNKNNGNLIQTTNGLDSGRTQVNTYDYLNRLLSAQTNATSGQDCWGQAFTYDRYGNLSTVGVTKCSAPSFALTPSSTTNRFTDSGFAYDNAGNMTNDTSTAYTYDAENEMTVAGSSTMAYDGDGLRVKSNSKLRWRMPGAGMYITTTDASGGTVKDMIYFAGQQVAQRVVSGSAVSYYFSDQVGSVHLMVDATATTCWDADYYPFGGWNVFTAGNCQPQYRYTLMETEPSMSSDVDYAMFRYYSHRFARFMSPDPLSGDPANPQSWNRFAHVINNPLRYIDPLGLACNSVGADDNYESTDPDCSGGGSSDQPIEIPGTQIEVTDGGGSVDTTTTAGGTEGPGTQPGGQSGPTTSGGGRSGGGGTGPIKTGSGHTVTPNQPLTPQQKQCVQNEINYADRVRTDFMAGQDGRMLGYLWSGAIAGAEAGTIWGGTAGTAFFGVGVVPGSLLGGLTGAVTGAGGKFLVGTAQEIFKQYSYDNSVFSSSSTYANLLQTGIKQQCGVDVKVK